ncbi:hypothetical protein M440DRAFT_228431 [Trichoderma longibrachiatum ATCC 18648]|uniref:Uncharacterized protein n=1 Tax=Trichoderma longibrachiatum ATCC 18648 TaxID=983965 RepID=A0A2T4CC14_TRILO|nr:hypothetical protein M440DRAFT_228431 [Trichoderma longibrachiatum ATCC 18648]
MTQPAPGRSFVALPCALVPGTARGLGRRLVRLVLQVGRPSAFREPGTSSGCTRNACTSNRYLLAAYPEPSPALLGDEACLPGFSQSTTWRNDGIRGSRASTRVRVLVRCRRIDSSVYGNRLLLRQDPVNLLKDPTCPVRTAEPVRLCRRAFPPVNPPRPLSIPPRFPSTCRPPRPSSLFISPPAKRRIACLPEARPRPLWSGGPMATSPAAVQPISRGPPADGLTDAPRGASGKASPCAAPEPKRLHRPIPFVGLLSSRPPKRYEKGTRRGGASAVC